MGLKLYNHQQELLNLNPKKHLLAWGTGTGKTLAAIRLVQKNTDNCLIICPKSIKDQWNDILKKEACDPLRWLVHTKEEFRKAVNLNAISGYDAIICDECFVAGTKVLTPKGYKNIEDIKTGELIINAISEGVVIGTNKREYYDDIYNIKLENGFTIKCTKNHLFFTEHGWLEAKEIEKKDKLLTYNYVNDMMSIDTNSFTLNRYVKMFKLRWKKSARFSREREKILLKSLSNEISLEKEKTIDDCVFNQIIHQQSFACYPNFNTNEKKQSNEKSKNKKKSKCNIKKNWSLSCYSWRKWSKNAIATKIIISRAWKWLVWRICGSNKENNEKFAECLQNRYSKSKKNDSSRGRWSVPLFTQKTRTRQKENKSINFIGVESISIQKQRSVNGYRESVKVYNLEVSGHPSYVVNDCLVHNCHHFSGMRNFKNKSGMLKALLLYIRKHNPVFIYILTATPYLSSPLNIFALADILGKKWNYSDFQNLFFVKVEMGRRWPVPIVRQKIRYAGVEIPTEQAISNLVNTLGNTVALEDCVDVPDQIFQTEYFDLTAEQKKAIKALDDIVHISYWTKCHQICGGSLKSDGYTKDAFYKSEKLNRILQLVQEHKKLIIICRYNNEIEYINIQIRKKTSKKTYIINGQTENKHDIIQSADGQREAIVLANAACSEGYELPSFPIMVFYSYDFSLKNYIQIKGRIQRINNIKKNVYISLIVKGTIDEDVYKCIMKKRDFQLAIYKK